MYIYIYIYYIYIYIYIYIIVGATGKHQGSCWGQSGPARTIVGHFMRVTSM